MFPDVRFLYQLIFELFNLGNVSICVQIEVRYFNFMCIYIHTHIYTHTCIYMYECIYMHWYSLRFLAHSNLSIKFSNNEPSDGTIRAGSYMKFIGFTIFIFQLRVGVVNGPG